MGAGGEDWRCRTARFEVNELPRELSLAATRRSDGNPITLIRTAGLEVFCRFAGASIRERASCHGSLLESTRRAGLGVRSAADGCKMTGRTGLLLPRENACPGSSGCSRSLGN